MSIASNLSRILTAKNDIKTAIEAKGVTVPAGAKLDAYPALIDGISGGGGAPGVGTVFTGATCPVTFKGNTNLYENEWEYKSDGALTITGLDSVATITGNGTNHVKVLFDVTSSTSSITLFNINVGDKTFVGRFFYYGAELTANQCLAVASLIAPESGAGVLDVNFKFIVSTTYPSFSYNTTAWQGVFSHQIIGFIFGKRVANTGNYFMRTCYAFNQPLTIPIGVTSIGLDFLAYCYAFNQSLTIPSGVTTIRENFLRNCSAFNQPLTIPSGVTTIGNYFLTYCSTFNQSLTIPSGVTTIGNYFLSYCYAFNQPLTIPSGVTTIGNYFLTYCSAFNQPLTIPSGVTTIGLDFLAYCYAFNQSLTIPSGVTTIRENFLRNCSAFNQPLTIQSGVTTIGDYFVYQCYALTLIRYEPDVYPTDNYALAQTVNAKTSATGTGIKVIGTNAAGLKAALPNRTASPFRKLV